MGSLSSITWHKDVYLGSETYLVDSKTNHRWNFNDIIGRFENRIDGNSFMFKLQIEGHVIIIIAVINNTGMVYKILKRAMERYYIYVGERKYTLDSYFKVYQPLFFLPDFSALCNNELFIKNHSQSRLNPKWFHKINWSEVDIRKEYREPDDKGRLSIHDKIHSLIISMNPEYCYYDHGTGEIADFIIAKNIDNKVVVTLFHCKGSKELKPGNRVEDLYEVCGQVVKSCIWFNSDTLLNKLEARYKVNKNPFFYKQDTYYVLKEMINNSNNNIRYRIVIVQPGINSEKIELKMEPMIISCNEYCIQNGFDEISFWCS